MLRTLFPRSMMQGYTLIASFVHGNALGVILEPAGVDQKVDQSARANTWQVKIGPLVPEVAIGTEYPKADFERVVRDLVKFCRANGITPPLTGAT